MRAVTFHGKRDVQVEEVPDPGIEQPTDPTVRVTSSGICGSDLHLYEVLPLFVDDGAILGHEPMGVVEEVGADVRRVAPGDRVVVPFNIACGSCWMCERKLFSQCETTQLREHGKGAALFGYSRLYGSVPGGQAEYLRVPYADFGPIKVPEGPPDERYVFLSDVLPTSWQAVVYADVGEGDTCVVTGLGPIGQMAARIARHRGVRTIGVDLVPERLAMAARHGVETVEWDGKDAVVEQVRKLTKGRGPDAVIDAVGLEAHGSAPAKLMQTMAGMLPDAAAAKLTEVAGVDRPASLLTSIELVRRGGTISVIGVYGGSADPIPMMELFDKQIQLRMGQANVKAWVDDILPLLTDEDPLGVHDLTTHTLPLEQAPHAYEIFQRKEDGAIKVLLRP